MNRFDTAVENPYISQYVPIPFEQLYALGKEYNAKVDKAYQNITDTVNDWKQFTSLSAKDMDTYDKLTMDRINGLINEISINPELMKTPEFRAKIQNVINTTDYETLAKLKQNAKDLEKRREIENQLRRDNRYNNQWHDFDYENFDSLAGKNVDLDLLPYMSEVELVHPYASQLKDTYLGTKGGYDWMGVNEDIINRQLDTYSSAIFGTPQAKKHIEVIMQQNPDLTLEEATEIFNNRVHTAGMQYARMKPEANEFSKLNHQYKLKYGNSNEDGRSPHTLTEMLEVQGLTTHSNAKSNYLASVTKDYPQIKKDLQSKDSKVVKAAQERLQKLYKETTPKTMFRDVIGRMINMNDSNRVFNFLKSDNTGDSLNIITNQIMDVFSYPIQNSKLNDQLAQTIPDISSDKHNTKFGKRYIISGGGQLDLTSNVISDIAGINLTSTKSISNFRNALKGNMFNNMIVLGNNRVLPIPIRQGGKDSTVNLQEVQVAISQEDLERAGVSVYDIKQSGGRQVVFDKGNSSSNTVSFEIIDNEEDDTKKVTQSQKKTPSEKYWVISLTSKLPGVGEGLSSEYLDQQALGLSINNTKRTEMYPDVQDTSLGM